MGDHRSVSLSRQSQVGEGRPYPSPQERSLAPALPSTSGILVVDPGQRVPEVDIPGICVLKSDVTAVVYAPRPPEVLAPVAAGNLDSSGL